MVKLLRVHMEIYELIVFLPLLGALFSGFLGNKIPEFLAMLVPSALLSLSAILSWVNFLTIPHGGIEVIVPLLNWVSVGEFQFNWALRVDSLTSVMFIVVNSVSALVHIYSIGYMAHDDSKARFFAYLSLFTFAMLMLVSADNFVQMFFGWEGVGLASYLLIGFWHHKSSANAAAMKAFLVNRVGDIGFALGIFAAFKMTGALQFDEFFAKVPDLVGVSINFLGFELPAITTICILLFIGAMGKSAQLGLHTWLPDAMEGPTPVSALIHAATMVTAGVFMVCRLSPLFEYSEFALNVITIIGASTAFFAATIGLTQTDIKRVIAYSTCSQLGYMFFAAGLSAYPVAMFHLTTHAFFKALLFLGAGSVIHAMGGEQDLRKMGGTFKLIKFSYIMMWIGSLALTGMPFFAGFYSKDAILEVAFVAHSEFAHYAFWMGIIAAFMTAFYSWRLLVLAFHGVPRASEEVMRHIHESPMVMLLPLALLAIGAIFSGYFLNHLFIGGNIEAFWGKAIFINPENHIMHAFHDVPEWVSNLPLFVGLAGIVMASFIYGVKPDWANIIAIILKPFYIISYNKWFFDEIYDFLLVKPAFILGKIFWRIGDIGLIDFFGPNGVAWLSMKIGRGLSRWQTGYVYHYVMLMIIGVGLFCGLIIYRIL